ncbi:hypothetical protein RO3G_13661 [Rhizopus delemar RA 99-880]|uniref:Uncharacterized protein n=1 Tax=Rhizopus delemar (strain RA 99-880 / ATCC MYA-4621 / FGSC 9543 / NRRL 43880) TaxID=246409 RepID=I1CKH0_RHIO9|nr:hypothetical protein RO3G_13661 [Rhizopus delemar RA 99-880]|eukprot:EIE88950.1 hypothetical protein RO3G_13661 [Rhizopus delemar RA 99-880]
MKDKQVVLWIAKKEPQRSSSKPMKRPTCGGTDHARSSSFKYLYHTKNKTEAH